jgi:hypothetical protein
MVAEALGAGSLAVRKEVVEASSNNRGADL